ncbi:MAG: hypothetical protein ABW068_04375 [Candidatus Thiodiazotropha sp.]
MNHKKRELQRRIAYEAARILTELRSDNISYACRKAAAKYGVTRPQLMPTHQEIDEALREQQRLIRGGAQTDALRALRQSAVGAMRSLQPFHPQLVGAVLDGTADINSHVELHLYADTPEDVLFTLSDLHIPWSEKQRLLSFSDGHREHYPCFQFSANDVRFELVVLPTRHLRKRPLGPIDNRPQERVNLKQLETLMAAC